MSKTTPKYKLMEAIGIAIALGQKALEEIRTLARTPGPPGEPGLGFDDFNVEYDGERTFTFAWSRGDQSRKKSFTVPVMIYRDIYDEKSSYATGDVVTSGGSMWIAKGNTTSRPGEGNTEWKMCVKRGRDGKDVVSIPIDPNKPVKI